MTSESQSRITAEPILTVDDVAAEPRCSRPMSTTPSRVRYPVCCHCPSSEWAGEYSFAAVPWSSGKSIPKQRPVMLYCLHHQKFTPRDA
jgi:hypothetical protein